MAWAWWSLSLTGVTRLENLKHNQCHVTLLQTDTYY